VGSPARASTRHTPGFAGCQRYLYEPFEEASPVGHDEKPLAADAWWAIVAALAREVVRATKANRARVRVGFDSDLGEWLKRLLPQAVHLPLQWGYARSHRGRAPSRDGA
jgi:hypothetical protein